MRVAILHACFFEHSEIDADCIAVLACLALHADQAGVCWPSQGLLAKLLNRSRPWVNGIIARLVEIGVIEKSDRFRDDNGGRRTSLYRLITPETNSHFESQTASDPESTASHPYGIGSQSGDIPCREPDINNKPEIQQDAHTACARENESISEVAKGEVVQKVAVQASVQEIRVAVTPEADWQPSDGSLIYAIERFPDADLQAATEKFVNRCRARGYRYFDLDSAWRVWLTEDQAAAMQGGAARYGGGGGQRTSAAQARFNAWAAVAARHQGSARYAA